MVCKCLRRRRCQSGKRKRAVGEHGGGGGQQFAGVRVLRRVEELMGGSLFDDVAVLHDGDCVCDLGDDGEIV